MILFSFKKINNPCAAQLRLTCTHINKALTSAPADVRAKYRGTTLSYHLSYPVTGTMPA
jgi:hypothetical protein